MFNDLLITNMLLHLSLADGRGVGAVGVGHGARGPDHAAAVRDGAVPGRRQLLRRHPRPRARR